MKKLKKLKNFFLIKDINCLYLNEFFAYKKMKKMKKIFLLKN